MNLFIDLKGAVMRVSPQRTSRIIFKTSVILLALLLIGSLSAHAATIAVTTTTDELTTPGTGCSLREAIQNINNGAATIYPECPDGAATGFGVNDTINVPAGTYTITLAGAEDNNARGDFDIKTAATITGAGATATIIQAGTLGYPDPGANGIDRVFDVPPAVATTFDNLTIRNGNGVTGGGIRARGAVTLTNSTVSGNVGWGTGGGVYSLGDVILTGSTVSGNMASGEVGGIYSGGALTLTNSTISNNTAGTASGGIYSGGALTLTNSTVSGNTASGEVGGIYAGAPVTMTNSTVSGNTAGTDFGGIYARSPLTLTNSTVSGNKAGATSGGIYAERGLTLTNSTVSGNTAGTDLGGIFSLFPLTLTNSTVSGNTAGTDFGGIHAATALTLTNSTVSGNTAGLGFGGVFAGGALTMTNSTVSGNSAGNGRGGGIGAVGAVTLTNSTIYGNNAAFSGGGVYGDNSWLGFSLTTSNSIIANNTGGDCFKTGGTFTSNGYNIDSDNTCNLVAPGDLLYTDPILGPLANNGGPTMTRALLPGSPAIDAGTCVIGTDQRGIARPQGAICDIGAYEAEQYFLTVTVSGAGMVTGGTGIDCPAALCSELYIEGVVVTLIASANSGETFTGWGGDCTAAGTATTCVVTMSAVKTVSASFGGYGCTDPAALNFNPLATIDDGSCVYTALIPGCTDPAATNYHPAATQDDGSCTYGSGGGGGSSGGGNQPPTAGRHGDKWLHYPDNGDNVGPDTRFVWDELIDPDGDTVFYDLYICLNGDFADCTPIPVTPSYRTVAAVGFGMTGALVIGFCFVGGVRTLRGRMLLTAALLVAGLTLSNCGNSSSSDESTTNGDRFSCDGEDGYSVCYDSKGLAAGDYQWRVTASDGKGATNTSETRSFTVE